MRNKRNPGLEPMLEAYWELEGLAWWCDWPALNILPLLCTVTHAAYLWFSFSVFPFVFISSQTFSKLHGSNLSCLQGVGQAVREMNPCCFSCLFPPSTFHHQQEPLCLRQYVENEPEVGLAAVLGELLCIEQQDLLQGFFMSDGLQILFV